MKMAPSVAIFDVDGVLVASPHERAWREALVGFANPASFTTAFYQAYVAGHRRRLVSIVLSHIELEAVRRANSMLHGWVCFTVPADLACPC
jgi:beta-phosphoglucomutase-like phosphatase (HAD superfamily)